MSGFIGVFLIGFAISTVFFDTSQGYMGTRYGKRDSYYNDDLMQNVEKSFLKPKSDRFGLIPDSSEFITLPYSPDSRFKKISSFFGYSPSRGIVARSLGSSRFYSGTRYAGRKKKSSEEIARTNGISMRGCFYFPQFGIKCPKETLDSLGIASEADKETETQTPGEDV